MLEEEKELLEERVRELTIQLDQVQTQSSKVSPLGGLVKVCVCLMLASLSLSVLLQSMAAELGEMNGI